MTTHTSRSVNTFHYTKSPSVSHDRGDPRLCVGPAFTLACPRSYAPPSSVYLLCCLCLLPFICILWIIALFLSLSLTFLPYLYNTPFTRALAMQSSGRNCNQAPDLVFWKLVFPEDVLLLRSVLHRDRHHYLCMPLPSNVALANICTPLPPNLALTSIPPSILGPSVRP